MDKQNIIEIPSVETDNQQTKRVADAIGALLKSESCQIAVRMISTTNGNTFELTVMPVKGDKSPTPTDN